MSIKQLGGIFGRNPTFNDVTIEGTLTTESGVVFGSTGGSVTSKTLDDYEEGTWTPTFNSASFTATSVSANGTYTRIGNIVHVRFTVSFIGTSGNFAEVDAASIGGLPFTVASSRQGGGTANASTGYLSGSRATWQCMPFNASSNMFLGCHFANGTIPRNTGMTGEAIYQV